MAEFPLGIQSYCFREFRTIPSLIGALKQVSLPFVEIFPGHVDYKHDRGKTDAAIAQIRDAGISVTAYGGVTITKDERDARALCDFVSRNGIHDLSVVTVDEGAIAMLEKLASEYGVRFCIHNHGKGNQFCSFQDVRSFLAKTSRCFGLCNDTAWFLDAGEDPVAAVHEFADRLYGVHVKDFRFDAKGKPIDVIVGTGGLDLPRFMKALKRVGFKGYMSLEYEGNPANPMADVLKCLEAIRAAMAIA